MNNKLVILIAFFVHSVGFAQTYSGTVLDAKTNQPLPSVTVYFDGTTIGVITDLDGMFNIASKQTINAPLVISYIGYKTQVVAKESLLNNPIIKLQPQTTNLDEVIVTDDDWSREKKLRYFKREFLGRSIYSKDCKITNIDKIRFRYSKVDQTMYAMADEPIIIINKYLGYKVEYNLIDFEIIFETPPSGFTYINKVLYSGTSVFSELNKRKIKKRYIKNRSFVYKTSLLYFMRSLANNSLKENGFRLFKSKDEKQSKPLFETTQSEVFNTKIIDIDKTQVSFLDTKKIVVSFENLDQAFLLPNTTDNVFYIDSFGIHYPIESILFGGTFGQSRIVNMLPSDYNLE
ncbi:carboxypeptidase-like regulatory domain-containing protein [uncultured Olleya sp.]|uniref:carboxypeptidase-like regulatory domain-containing protein n=1 Tax=uncultured Olleya sp. TaxID=757243 RepID=UPI002596A71E|nr:carboxypeptidase-like regulatory domain-containing protein [uncultured Olleya sp.]